MALRHHDEAARTRAVDNFSDDLRVVARREAVTARESRLVVPSRLRRTASADDRPPRPRLRRRPRPRRPATHRGGVATDSATASPPRGAAARVTAGPAAPVHAIPAQRRASAHRAAARAAARRRRIVLGLLLLVTAGVGVGLAHRAPPALGPGDPRCRRRGLPGPGPRAGPPRAARLAGRGRRRRRAGASRSASPRPSAPGGTARRGRPAPLRSRHHRARRRRPSRSSAASTTPPASRSGSPPSPSTAVQPPRACGTRCR